MTGLPPRRPGAVRTRLLSVTGVVVVGLVGGSLLLWHAQLGDTLGLAAANTSRMFLASAVTNPITAISSSAGNTCSAASSIKLEQMTSGAVYRRVLPPSVL